MNISAVISSLFIVIGCFLPWIQMGPLINNKGVNNPDGIIILVLGISALVISIATKKKYSILNFLLGAASGVVATIDYKDIAQRVTSSEGLNDLLSISVGSGIYLVLIGSGLLVVVSVIDVISGDKNKNDINNLNQVEIISPKNIKEKSPEEIENENYKANLILINSLIQKEMGKWSEGSFNDEIKNAILKSAQTKEEWNYLVRDYQVLFNSDLINDLKKLSGSHELLNSLSFKLQ